MLPTPIWPKLLSVKFVQVFFFNLLNQVFNYLLIFLINNFVFAFKGGFCGLKSGDSYSTEFGALTN